MNSRVVRKQSSFSKKRVDHIEAKAFTVQSEWNGRPVYWFVLAFRQRCAMPG